MGGQNMNQPGRFRPLYEASDYKSLKCVLGTRFVLATGLNIPGDAELGDLERPDVQEGESTATGLNPIYEDDYQSANMVFEFIAFKWNGSGRGGWQLGQVVDYIKPDERQNCTLPCGTFNCNFKVHFPEDSKMLPIPLHKANYCQEPMKETVKGHWLFLLPKPLTDENAASLAQQGVLQPPTGTYRKRRGQPRTLRYMPQHGPTSRDSLSRRNKGDNTNSPGLCSLCLLGLKT